MRCAKLRILLFALGVAVISGCSQEEVSMSEVDIDGLKNYAQEFAKALAAREYSRAYSMVSKEFIKESTQNQMKSDFESIVPLDWVFWGPDGEPVKAADPILDWPDKQSSDVGIVYVSIGGQMYSEAVTVTVESVEGLLKIRDVEYGRP